MNNKYLVLFITVPNEETGLKIANELVNNHLVACVNIISNVRSIYFWKGKVEDDQEYLLFLKTRVDLIEDIITAVKKIHPYEVPEIIGLPILVGNSEYLSWISEVTKENE